MKTTTLALLLSLSFAGCAVAPTSGVERLGDGVMRSRTAAQAELFCRTTGDPTRLLTAPDAPDGVVFRCD